MPKSWVHAFKLGNANHYVQEKARSKRATRGGRSNPTFGAGATAYDVENVTALGKFNLGEAPIVMGGGNNLGWAGVGTLDSLGGGAPLPHEVTWTTAGSSTSISSIHVTAMYYTLHHGKQQTGLQMAVQVPWWALEDSGTGNGINVASNYPHPVNVYGTIRSDPDDPAKCDGVVPDTDGVTSFTFWIDWMGCKSSWPISQQCYAFLWGSGIFVNLVTLVSLLTLTFQILAIDQTLASMFVTVVPSTSYFSEWWEADSPLFIRLMWPIGQLLGFVMAMGSNAYDGDSYGSSWQYQAMLQKYLLRTYGARYEGRTYGYCQFIYWVVFNEICTVVFNGYMALGIVLMVAETNSGVPYDDLGAAIAIFGETCPPPPLSAFPMTQYPPYRCHQRAASHSQFRRQLPLVQERRRRLLRDRPECRRPGLYHGQEGDALDIPVSRQVARVSETRPPCSPPHPIGVVLDSVVLLHRHCLPLHLLPFLPPDDPLPVGHPLLDPLLWNDVRRSARHLGKAHPSEDASDNAGAGMPACPTSTKAPPLCQCTPAPCSTFLALRHASSTSERSASALAASCSRVSVRRRFRAG